MTTTASDTPAAARPGHPPVYHFSDGEADGHGDLKELLGGKGAGLAEMSSIGIPVPPGFTITTEVCNAFYALGRRYPDGLEAAVQRALAETERLVGASFGDAANPLLVSVRSGARVSMPGMMDTVLNLGTQRRDRRGARAALRQPALRVRLLPALRADVRRRRAGAAAGVGLRSRPVRGTARAQEAGAWRRARHGAERGRSARAGGGVQGGDPRAAGRRLSGRSVGAAVGRDRRRLQLLGEPARRGLPRHVRLPLQLGDRRQRAGDGLRQPRRGLRHRRRLHARPGHRRGAAQRRVPGERAGRGRGRWHPHPAGP